VTRGQPALIRVDSFPDRLLHGHVDLVATVSSQQDFFSSDVKVYTTKVRIDGTMEDLKPGMSAEVTITVGDTLEHVLTVPIQAIVGSVEMGRKRKCFVVTPNGPVERDIVVGQSNERMAEIKEGLEEDDEVVLNPKALAGEKAKTRQPAEGRAGGSGDVKPDADGKSSSPKGKDKGKEKDKQKTPAEPEKRPMASRDSAPMGGDRSQLSPEERQKQQQQMTENFRKAAPEQRKQMLEQVPEAYRDKVKERLKEQGIEIK
jgi:hypothetical protein